MPSLSHPRFPVSADRILIDPIEVSHGHEK
jgi:hypothetical protein